MKLNRTFTPISAAVLGVLVFAAGCGQAPESISTATAPASKKSDAIAWTTALEPALAKARETGKPVMVDFFATWCPPCKMLDAKTYTDSRVQDESEKWVMVRIDVDHNKPLAEQYRIQSIPTLVFITAEGKEVNRAVGYIDADTMLKMMQKHRSDFPNPAPTAAPAGV